MKSKFYYIFLFLVLFLIYFLCVSAIQNKLDKIEYKLEQKEMRYHNLFRLFV